MKKLDLPDSSILVESITKAKDTKGVKGKSVSVFLGKDVVLPGGSSDFNDLENRPSYKGTEMDGNTDIPEVKNYTAGDNITITQDGDNYVIASTGGGGVSTIIADTEPNSDTVAEPGQFFLDTSDDELFICTKVEDGKTSWEFVELKKLIKYGELTFYPNWEGTVDIKNAQNVTFNGCDFATWSAWAAAHPLEEWDIMMGYNFDYQEGAWVYYSMSEPEPVVIPEEDMYATTGLDMTCTDDWGYIQLDTLVNVDTSVTKTVDVLGERQFHQLCFESENVIAGPFGEEHDMVMSATIKTFFLDDDVVTDIPDNFLQACTRLELMGTYNRHEPWFEKGIKTIGNNFLRKCHSLSSPSGTELNFGGNNNLEKIGDYCLADIGRDVDNWTPNFTKLNLSASNLKSCGTGLVSFVKAQVVLTPNLGVYGPNFGYQSSFTDFDVYSDSLHLPANIPDGFMAFDGCFTLTNPRSLFVNVETIGDTFFAYTPVNCPLNFPSLTKVGGFFLSNCSQFNSTLTVPNLEQIGEGFMRTCSSFAQPIQMNYVRSIDEEYFMSGCNNFVGPLTINNAYVTLGGNRPLSCLSTYQNNAPMYTTGVTIRGAGRQAILALGNRTSSPYRKLVDGGA